MTVWDELKWPNMFVCWDASGELDLSQIWEHDHDDDQKGFSNFGQTNSGHGEFPL